MIFGLAKQKPRFRQIKPAMEALMTKPALVTDYLVLRTATEEAEIHQLHHLRQAQLRPASPENTPTKNQPTRQTPGGGGR